MSWTRAAAVGLVLGATGLWLWPPEPPAASAVAPARGARSSGSGALPLVGLARLSEPQAAAAVGRRNLFEFDTPPRAASPAVSQPVAPPPTVRPSGPPVEAAAPGGAEAAPNLRYIGSLDRDGLRVAVLLTDRDEVLTGREGEVVGHRFRIVQIGFESVDLRDEASLRVRRIPLKGD